MDSWIDRFLAHHYDQLRATFLKRVRWRTPPEFADELEDIFQEWCIQLLTDWRDREPPDFVVPPEDDAAFRSFLSGTSFLWPFRFWPWPYRYWQWPYWPSTQYWARRLHRPPSGIVESLDLTIHDQPAPPEPMGFEVELDPIGMLAPHLGLQDLEVLMAFRGATSRQNVAERLSISGATLSRRIRRLRERAGRLGEKLKAAIASVLFGKIVFLSSTYSDLREYRYAIIDKIHKLAANGVPLVVIAMEYFMTGSGHPGGRCLALVRRADIYVGLFARRYGSVWDEMGISFTEAELREAETKRIERCIYFPTERCLATFPVNNAVDDLQRITLLKVELSKAYIVERFDSPDELASRVADRLSASFWRR